MRAIETTGILNTQGQIQLDHPIPQEKDRFVRVILLMSEDELNEKNWLDAVALPHLPKKERTFHISQKAIIPFYLLKIDRSPASK